MLQLRQEYKRIIIFLWPLWKDVISALVSSLITELFSREVIAFLVQVAGADGDLPDPRCKMISHPATTVKGIQGDSCCNIAPSWELPNSFPTSPDPKTKAGPLGTSGASLKLLSAMSVPCRHPQSLLGWFMQF